MSIAIELSESELSVVLSGASTVLSPESHLIVPLSELNSVSVTSLEVDDPRAEADRINAARGA